MKVIFLDFDGVLNSIQWHIQMEQGGAIEFDKFDPMACSNLKWVLSKSEDIKIVVSSSWRHGRTVNELRDLLEPMGIARDRIIDKTTNRTWDGTCRGDEIKMWLDAHPETESYVIIDDDSDMLEEQQNNFVHTSTIHGLILGDAIKVGRILKVDTEKLEGYL